MRPLAMLLISTILLTTGVTAAQTTQRTELEGIWIARSIEQDGKPVPAAIVARTRYTFKGNELLVRGNFADDREEHFVVSVDASDTPKYLDLTDDNGYPTPGIYEIKGDVLTVCLGRSERPAECKPAMPRVTRLVFQRQSGDRSPRREPRHVDDGRWDSGEVRIADDRDSHDPTARVFAAGGLL